jgi:polyhydroxybutyrate depolymerase
VAAYDCTGGSSLLPLGSGAALLKPSLRDLSVHKYFPALLSLLILSFPLFAQEIGEPKNIQLQVDKIDRDALVFFPPKSNTSAPVVFAFHGHGGNAIGAAKSFAIQKHWPTAIVVYMQGLNTPGILTDPEGKKTGWQDKLGEQNDRDLKFFDALLSHLRKEFKIDENKIYCTGHSNGGGFTYTLWQTRGDVFAAVAPCASFAVKFDAKPKPCIHFAGENDALVKIEWQQKTIERVKEINGCESKGKEWAKDCNLYPSSKSAPLVVCIHPGTHQFPAFAPELMVKFFQSQSKPASVK